MLKDEGRIWNAGRIGATRWYPQAGPAGNGPDLDFEAKREWLERLSVRVAATAPAFTLAAK